VYHEAAMPTFQERTKAQFAVVYLTLISVIQACVLGYFFTQADLVLAHLNMRTALFLFTSFLLIALVWNEYMMWTSVVRWVLRLTDSIMPLLLGVLQFGMIRSIPARSPAYFLVMAAFLGASLVKYRHGIVAGGREPENVALLASLKRWNVMSEWLLVAGIALSLLAAWLDARFDAGRGTWPWAAGLVAVFPIVYIVRAIRYWRFVCPVDPGGASAGKG
jgi:hypothetical protein